MEKSLSLLLKGHQGQDQGNRGHGLHALYFIPGLFFADLLLSNYGKMPYYIIRVQTRATDTKNIIFQLSIESTKCMSCNQRYSIKWYHQIQWSFLSRFRFVSRIAIMPGFGNVLVSGGGVSKFFMCLKTSSFGVISF